MGRVQIRLDCSRKEKQSGTSKDKKSSGCLKLSVVTSFKSGHLISKYVVFLKVSLTLISHFNINFFQTFSSLQSPSVFFSVFLPP